MKVVFPKNIQRGILAGMTFQIGPISLSIIQLFILAIGIGAGMWIFNKVSQSGSKAAGIIFALPIIIIFFVIAFFQVSELKLLAFISKKIRTNFFDTTIKYQINYSKISPFNILLHKIKATTTNSLNKNNIEQKNNKINSELLDQIKTGGLI